MTVGSVAKVTDAGIQVRFRTVDPKLAPQPVLLKAGASAKVMFVRFSRAFEITRTDFARTATSE